MSFLKQVQVPFLIILTNILKPAHVINLNLTNLAFLNPAIQKVNVMITNLNAIVNLKSVMMTTLNVIADLNNVMMTNINVIANQKNVKMTSINVSASLKKNMKMIQTMKSLVNCKS